ncbi:TonB-dependent receptor [Alteromonas sp. RKMC-009]|uniref:TonB-dependent receptor n=1 Tax=Alteromonas sp. RKMC-009 TaxID=2267264 RepID=UPI000E67891C|nr:TonB-dependent receptor [Alteromonas sp. RKMC-009]AYA63468.1 TonB-dependent siderophore receptor [Alteromonas sp. RKMC-009]
MAYDKLGSGALLTALAISVSAAHAEEAKTEKTAAEKEQQAVELIKIHGVRNSIYNVKRSGDARRLADLIDTPATITVLTKDQIEESGRSDLKEVLSTQAGVTLGTGENGNAFGDRYIIRGHEARSDVFVDGLRDPGMNTRESFSVEQIEITKGPSSTFAGRGSSGGAINSITKKASLDYDFGRVDVGAGTDNYLRGTVDVNTPQTENFATRVNIMKATEDAPKRDGAERERQGALISGLYDNLTDLKVWADFYYLKAEDVPDLGSTAVNDVIIEDIPVYAQNGDFLTSEATSGTLRVEYELNDDWKIYSITRYGKTDNGYLATSAGGTTGYATEEDATNGTNGYTTFTFGTHSNWQDVEHFATQLNLFANLDTGSVEHKFLVSAEYADYSVLNGRYADTGSAATTNCWASGRGGVSETFCGLDASGNAAAGLNSVIDRSAAYEGDYTADYNYEVSALSLMDTMQVTKELMVFAGIRFDSYDYSNGTVGRSGAADFAYSDTLVNGHFGLVYEAMDDVNLYASYGTASNINGGESDVGGNCGYGGVCTDSDGNASADPETVENLEIGTKMSLNDESLFVQLAAFKLTKDDVMEGAGRGYDVTGSLNTGKHEVTGVEVAVNGQVTEALSIQISGAIMDSEILESVSSPDSVGLPLALFANKSFYAQARYQLTEDFAFGGDFTYKDKMTGGQPDTGSSGPVVPSYNLVNLFALYNFTDDITVRLNFGNVFDKEYYTSTYRAPKFMYIGDRQSLRATLTYQF